MKTNAFVKGFLKSACAHGCTIGEAWDMYKFAFGGIPPTPSYAPTQPINPNPPIIDTVKPSSMFPVSGGASGGMGSLGSGTSGGVGSLGGGGSGALSAPKNFGFNINQTGMGGVNNSVTSAPGSSVNSVLNKPVTPSATPML